MNTNIFGLKISTEYEYEYIRWQRYLNTFVYFRIFLNTFNAYNDKDDDNRYKVEEKENVSIEKPQKFLFWAPTP